MKRPLGLDYLPHHPHPVVWAVLMMSAILFGIAAKSYLQIKQQETQLLSQYAVLSPGRKIFDTPHPEVLDSPTIEKIAGISKVVASLSVPWDALFSAVERTRPDDVSVLMLEPLVAKRQLTVQAEARDMQQMLHYIEALQRQQLFTNILLLKHDIVQDDTEHPVRFVVQAQWSGI